METDPQQLPEDAAILRRMVLQLLQAVEDKDRLLERVQHQLQQLLRQRYGPKRERIEENQLLLFAAKIIAAHQHGVTQASTSPAAAAASSGTAGNRPGQGHGRKPLPESLERKRVVWDIEERQRKCPHCQIDAQDRRRHQ